MRFCHSNLKIICIEIKNQAREKKDWINIKAPAQKSLTSHILSHIDLFCRVTGQCGIQSFLQQAFSSHTLKSNLILSFIYFPLKLQGVKIGSWHSSCSFHRLVCCSNWPWTGHETPHVIFQLWNVPPRNLLWCAPYSLICWDMVRVWMDCGDQD